MLNAGCRLAIETARGLWNALDIAQAHGVQRLAFGALDFRLDLGLPDAGYEQLGTYRAQLVLASRVAGIAPPADSPTPALNDEALIRAEAVRARNLGFGAKLCVHPSQVSAVNGAFVPSTQELEWARRVVEAARASGGAAIALDGKMIDRPVLDLRNASSRGWLSDVSVGLILILNYEPTRPNSRIADSGGAGECPSPNGHSRNQRPPCAAIDVRRRAVTNFDRSDARKGRFGRILRHRRR
jgi:hypothetical protein